MTIARLAFRNLIGAGLRTWLNVIVLSFAFVAIIWTQGLLEGMNEQVAHAVTEAEYAGGQYWHEQYDAYDPFSLQDAHGNLNDYFKKQIRESHATPILIVQGSIYPAGRMRPVLIKGIDPHQKIISIPSAFLDMDSEEIPVLIGNRMAHSTGLETGDYVIVQWRDVNGAIDAQDAVVVQIMNTTVPTIDNGQIWIPLQRLQKITGMQDQATIVVMAKDFENAREVTGWRFKDLTYLLKDITEVIESKTASSSIMYIILLFLAMIAIFDTQVLSIFKRRKEMGTLMALGLTRARIIQLFTLEGALNGMFALVVGAIYGIPLLIYTSQTGFALPKLADSYGFAIGERLFPAYGAGLVLATTILVFIITTVVSYMPTRKIARLKPTDALRGRMT